MAARNPHETLSESVLDDLSNQLYDNNMTLGTRRATDWMIGKLKSMSISRNQLMRDNARLRAETFIGGMFFYFYDPKLKKTLPYYDTFPLVIPIGLYPDGFLGLNLHYISPRERTEFLKRLSAYTNNTRYDETTKFKLKYNLLRDVSQLDNWKPCIKRYLGNHIRSQFLEVSAYEWYIACLLPVANFQKQSERQVWKQSRNIRKGV